MADPITIYKITTLAMLDKVDFPLSNTQIINFFLENDYTDFFTIHLIINELLDSELMSAEVTHDNTQYTITAVGLDTLNYLADKLTPAIEEDINLFFQKNKVILKKKNSVVADFYKNTQNGYSARCKLKENNNDVLDITINVGTKEQAEAICSNWQKKNVDVFASLMDLLLT
ncbi:MAG: DUF4364 family protein [Lachnospiraceae bacterium]